MACYYAHISFMLERYKHIGLPTYDTTYLSDHFTPSKNDKVMNPSNSTKWNTSSVNEDVLRIVTHDMSMSIIDVTRLYLW